MMKKSKFAFVAAGMASTMLIGGSVMAEKAKVAPKAKPGKVVADKAAQKKVDKWAFLPEVVAEVDGKKITRKEIGAMIDKILAGSPYAAMMNEAMLKRMAPNVIKNYVESQVLLKLAEAAGIKPSPELVKKDLEEAIKKAPKEQLAMVKKQLAAQGKTMDQYIKEASADKNAQDQTAIKTWVMTKIEPTIKVSEKEEKEYYEKNKKTIFFTPEQVEASHILIPSSKMPQPGKKPAKVSKEEAEKYKKAAKAKAEKLLADIKAGKIKFEDAAEKESFCPSGKKAKGSLGKFGRDQMAPEFEKAAFSLGKAGELSGIVETNFGYHIIRLDKKIAPMQHKFDEPGVKKKIDQVLKGKQLRKIIMEKMKAAKKQYKVKVFVKPPAPPKMPMAPPMAPPKKK